MTDFHDISEATIRRTYLAEIDRLRTEGEEWKRQALYHNAEHGKCIEEIRELRAVLQTIVDSHDARSELYTNDADCTGNLADRARAALQVTDR